jgi:hypothetical protein
MKNKHNIVTRYTIIGTAMLMRLSPFALISLLFTYLIGASKNIKQYNFAEMNARMCFWLGLLEVSLSLLIGIAIINLI